MLTTVTREIASSYSLRAIVSSLWVVAVMGAGLSIMFPVLSDISAYGVCRKESLINVPEQFQLQTRTAWLFMYTVGSGMGLAVLVFHLLTSGVTGTPIVQWMFVVQALRRLYEAAKVHRHRDAPMNPVVALLGTVYYVLVGVTLFCEKDVAVTLKTFRVSYTAFVCNTLASELFIVASVLQHRAHAALANVAPLKGKYGVVRGGLFEIVCCPHYTCEVAIYASFLAMCPSRLIALDFLFVAGNLTQSARERAKWYERTFASNYLPTNRKSIFPGVL